jgi:hypothetical protein
LVQGCRPNPAAWECPDPVPWGCRLGPAGWGWPSLAALAREWRGPVALAREWPGLVALAREMPGLAVLEVRRVVALEPWGREWDANSRLN